MYITSIYYYVHNLFKQVYVHIISMLGVKLKKVASRIDRDINRKYYRYDITIPNADIEKLGWKNVRNLKSKVERGKLIIDKE